MTWRNFHASCGWKGLVVLVVVTGAGVGGGRRAAKWAILSSSYLWSSLSRYGNLGRRGTGGSSSSCWLGRWWRRWCVASAPSPQHNTVPNTSSTVRGDISGIGVCALSWGASSRDVLGSGAGTQVSSGSARATTVPALSACGRSNAHRRRTTLLEKRHARSAPRSLGCGSFLGLLEIITWW